MRTHAEQLAPLLFSGVPRIQLLLALCYAIAGSGCGLLNPAVAAPLVIEPVTVSRDMAYAHSADALRAAYRRALEDRGLAVSTDSSGALTTVIGSGSFPGIVRVAFAPSDTLATRVTITYRYEVEGTILGNDFHHYPYRLPLQASPLLDPTLARVSLSQGTFPRARQPCPLPPFDTSYAAEHARLADGAGAFANRVEYTEAARLREVQGIVYLAAAVNEEGRVTCVEVLSGLPHGLTESAVRVMLGTSFIPARRNGIPIAVRVIQPVWFKLLE